MLTVIVLTAIGLAAAALIYLVNVVVPRKVQGLEKTEEIASILPGINCGACGKPGCFAYAQALTKDADVITKSPCAFVLLDNEKLEQLEKALGVTLDASEMNKKALIHCNGNSEIIYNYSGVETCKGAAQLLSGYRKCPYACLGIGDCLVVCPQNAISINPENGMAVIDPEKCTGCGLCIAECPLNLIELVPAGTKVAFLCNYQPLRDIPGREKCDFGCIHCRKCFNICEYDAITWNKEKAIPEFDIEKCTRCGKCIEVCPNHTLAEKIETKAPVLSLAGTMPGGHCAVPER
jgi:Na+-translocating ferredoxin:NAD+ oxidoreductase RNF subunit RnfB